MISTGHAFHKEKRIWFILLAALYYHSVMFSSVRWITYVYYYLIPLVYLLAHISWLARKVNRLMQGRLLYIPLCGIAMLLYGVLAPLISGTNDFTYVLRGPVWWLVQHLFVSLFLLCVYENAVTDRPDPTEFMACYVASQSCYVAGTLLILVIPGARQWIVDHVYMTELQAEVISRAEHVSRIGWSGFSGFVPTMQCSLCAVFCFYLLLRFKDDSVRTRRYNVLLLLSLVGNLCYGRVGMLASAACFVLYFLCLLLVKPEKALLYPAVFLVMLGALILLAQYKEQMRSWFEWSFSQVLSFVRTGSFETYTISNLKNMYQVPPPETFLFGDGVYTEGDHYYMHTDVGWLRPIYFYGLIPSVCGFLLAVCGIFRLRSCMTGISKRESIAVVCMLLVTYLLFESKGETFYVFAAILIPILLTGEGEAGTVSARCLEAPVYDNGIDECLQRTAGRSAQGD